jgi:hypothetical protein
MLKRLISPFSKLLIRGCVSRKKAAASACVRPPQRVNVLAQLEQQVGPYRQVQRFLCIKSHVLEYIIATVGNFGFPGIMGALADPAGPFYNAVGQFRGRPWPFFEFSCETRGVNKLPPQT